MVLEQSECFLFNTSDTGKQKEETPELLVFRGK